jgi:carboxypeptidase D
MRSLVSRVMLTGIVTFDIGESYAGLMPISNKTNASELYFWFFPSANPAAEKEILIWLNGGPGCSSLEGKTCLRVVNQN